MVASANRNHHEELSMRVLPALSAALLTVGPALAQCPFSGLSASSYGQGCNPVFSSNQITLSGSLDFNACSLDITVDGFGGCCKTFVAGRLLVLGDQPASVPLPQFGAGCTLLVNPAVILFEPGSSVAGFSLPLANAMPPLTLYAQGSVLYFTTIGLTLDFALSQGTQVDLS
jgi:hypothetical protein